ncbi:MAG: ATP-dependent DNA ligase [Desulfobacterales bacterium]|jgi:DNA ligase-1
MKLFSQLYTALDETTRTNLKVQALVDYFQQAPPIDAAWAIHFLIGRKPRQVVPTRKLKKWAARLAGIPDWLFAASYDVVGDLAETITLVLPLSARVQNRPLHVWVEEILLPLRGKDEAVQQHAIVRAWQELDNPQRFVCNKLITGAFRVGVSQRLVTRALSQMSGIDAAVIAHRLMGEWTPDAETYRQILSTDTRDTNISRPYPFYLAYPLDREADKLGAIENWQAEWKWDGVRAQVIKRNEKIFIWSRGEELVTDKFPEIVQVAQELPNGTVLDGEILAWQNDQPLNFSELQRRIGRKHVGPKLLKEVPVILMAYDILEVDGNDIRDRALTQRFEALTQTLAALPQERLLRISPVTARSWQQLAEAREQARSRGVEGLMLKRLSSPYRVGRRRSDWWKWKVDPLMIDAVLLYAQRGHGRRSGLYTDYTFAVWDADKLVPFAKAYSGLTDAEIRLVDRFVRSHTLERFGPVRSVEPELVFEIAFEDIRRSSRHKSGIAVRFPRISRWRTDKKIQDADSLQTLKSLLTVV